MRNATVAAMLVLAACSDSSTPAASAQAAAPPAPAPVAAPRPPAAKLDCARIFPKELLSKHGLASATGKLDSSGSVIDCDLGGGGGLMKAGINCPTWGSDEKVMRESMENGKRAFKDAKELAGVGRMGYAGSMVGIAMIQFWDDDTPCFVSMTVENEAKGTALARDLVASLTPAAIAP